MKKLNELPVAQQFELIRREWANFDHLAIQSPTGSGKSLALPALLSSNGMVEGQILVVQPRRVAARLLAKRLAALLGVTVGDEIGYQVRFDSKVSHKTKIIYLTDGVLLRKLFDDRTLSRVGLVIFDEFHERQSDFFVLPPSLGILRQDLDKTQQHQEKSWRPVRISASRAPCSIQEPIWEQLGIGNSATKQPANFIISTDDSEDAALAISRFFLIRA